MTQPCHRCGVTVPQGRNVCPNCGAVAHESGTRLLCSHCHRPAPSHLTLCPHCGRTLKPWKPYRTLTVIGILLFLLLWLNFAGGWSTVSRVGSAIAALIPPPATASPAPVLAELEPVPLPTETLAPAAIQPTPTSPPPTIELTPLVPDDASAENEEPKATATATPEPTATSDPTIYVVKAGDTLSGVASQLGLSVNELMAHNNIKDANSLRINQQLRIPQPTPTAAPSKTPTPEPTATPSPVNQASPTKTATTRITASSTPTAPPAPTATPQPAEPDIYVVKPGDTLFGIAVSVGRSAEALAAYNDIKDPSSLRVNQQLRIPPADYTPPPTATPKPTKRPTDTPTPTPVATPTPAITLAAPALINPSTESSYQGKNAVIVLSWQNPGGLPGGLENVVYIGVVTGPSSIDWRLTEPVGAATEFRVPAWMFGQASQDFGRAYVWYIQAASVTRSGGEVTAISPVSQPSERRKFYWN